MEGEEAALLEAARQQLGSPDVQGQFQEVMVREAGRRLLAQPGRPSPARLCPCCGTLAGADSLPQCRLSSWPAYI